MTRITSTADFVTWTSSSNHTARPATVRHSVRSSSTVANTMTPCTRALSAVIDSDVDDTRP
ncbi:hypothetical protein [Streptomyces coeruleorubidus]|uniref:hypothetical protein n=1 Tax=Streptomyces coeruleorubidus TaxID=116188 RepID=UPI0036B19071